MRFSLLLLILYRKLRKASRNNKAFMQYISTMKARVLIRTADGKRGRLFIFDRGNVSCLGGADHQDFDVSLVWSDAAAGFKVMLSGTDEASFRAAAQGKLTVQGMPIFAQWFTEGVRLIL
jgi:hypothetical protein